MSTEPLFSIQTATWRDLNALRRLEQECFPEDVWPLWDLIGVLTLSGIVRLKAVVNGEMIGFIAGEIKRQENTGWISTVGVSAGFRRQGIATALLNECEQRMGLRRVRLCVRTTNQPALHLYNHLGYSRVDIWHQYYSDGADAFILEKILK